MQKIGSDILFSASDLVNFLECEHLTALDFIHLTTPLQRTEDSEQAKLVQDKGFAHEERFWKQLQDAYARTIDISSTANSIDEKVAATTKAMRAGYNIIYQGTLRDGNLIGHSDFLRKIPLKSHLGDWSYEVLDTKLAKTPKAKFVIQLSYYSLLLAKLQGIAPAHMYVVLGDGTEKVYRTADYSRYLNNVIDRFLSKFSSSTWDSKPTPCDKCDLCHWFDTCKSRWTEEDHLSQVANITKIQIKKLESAGVTTLKSLAQLDSAGAVPKMNSDTLARLRSQAALQLQACESGENKLELLPIEAGQLRGFARLPEPNAGDLFFDMEGNPLEEGGLEYLFGVYYFDAGKPQFKAFWAHNRQEERLAFEDFIDFVVAWLRVHPQAHIYHYAAYEQTAVKRLMSLHGTREAEVDNLLRRQKFIDLYKVVREGLRVSEPKYSIKNIEHFYLDKRMGDVTNAGASIVYYERWKETGDPKLLEDIERYNFDDVRSTHGLRQWLLTLRPLELTWALPANAENISDAASERMKEWEVKLIPYREALVDKLPAERNQWTEIDRMCELTYQMLDFHRRANKPAWWAMFARMEMSEEELLEDGECLAGLIPDEANPPEPVARSLMYTFLYPEQESKLKTGDRATIAATGYTVRDLTVDEENRRVTLKVRADVVVDQPLALGPANPIDAASLTEALFRFASSLIEGRGRYAAIESLLQRQTPHVRGHQPGSPLIPEEGATLDAIINVIRGLEKSYMFIQGPPGAGKTYTGSRIIASLIAQGKRVGVASNSHKAINNLLSAVEAAALEAGIEFFGLKKSTNGREETCFDGRFIHDVQRNDEILASLNGPASCQLIAGTAWLFADAGLDQLLDYLFVDEAGQVALANLVAMGTSAQNIILLGDQMQLGQPIQGVHPGRSGESSLEYLLNGQATISPDKGIFLGTTWRMHPDICHFISDAIYDGRLQTEPANTNQRLVLGRGAHPLLKPTGIVYVPAEHDGCGQRSSEEAKIVSELYSSLLQQGNRNKKGEEKPLTIDDILVVAPYNMQVNLLKKALPEGARVGTVDKFQGQEAEVVIVSMATSSEDFLPRHIDFLYDKNRLNVAISRARCLALFVANPALMSIYCSKPEEMALVNTLCWVREAGANSPPGLEL